MCGICVEGAVIGYFEYELKNNKLPPLDNFLCFNYAQETKFLKELLLSIKNNDLISEIWPVIWSRVLEDVLLPNKIDYLVWDEGVLSRCFEKNKKAFLTYQEKSSWLKKWTPLYQKESALDSKMLKDFFSEEEVKELAQIALDYYLQKFTGEPEIEEPSDYGVIDEEDREGEDVNRYEEYKEGLRDELYVLFPVFYSSLVYLAKFKYHFSMLEDIVLCSPICLIDFYGLDLWLKRRAMCSLIDIKGTEIVPVLINNLCKVDGNYLENSFYLRHVYLYCLKNPSQKEKIDKLIKEKLDKIVINEWINVKKECASMVKE